MSVAIVRAIRDELEAHGVDLTGPCGAFQVTSRVAWALAGAGYGLVHKEPGQNGCDANGDRYAIDAVMLRDGTTIDILINAGGNEDQQGNPIPHTGNEPAWNITGAQPPDRWRAPFDPDAGQDEPDEPESPPVDAHGRLDAIDAALARIDAGISRLEAGVKALQIEQRVIYLRQDRAYGNTWVRITPEEWKS